MVLALTAIEDSMADEQAQTTGTPTQDGGDAAAVEPTTGTPETDGRNAVADSNINRDEALAWKAKAERLNEIERENQELRARLQPPAADEDDPEVEHYEACQAAIAEARRNNQRPPAWAVADVRRYEREQQRDQVIGALFETAPEPTRAAVKEYAKNPNAYPGGIRQAQAELERRALSAAQSEKDQRIAQLEKELQQARANRVDPNTVRTSGSEGPTSAPTTEIIPRAQWQERLKRMTPDERMAEQQRVIKKEVELR